MLLERSDEKNWRKTKGMKEYLINLLAQTKHTDIFGDQILISGSEVLPAAQRYPVWEAMTNLVKQPSALVECM